MLNYRGIECPVCKEQFSNDEDIVVCPECGTPHHRDCYKENNRCANEAMHGKEFFENPNEKASTNTKLCPRCQTPNPAQYKQCQICGVHLDAEQPNSNQKQASEDEILTRNFSLYGIPTEVKGESIADLNRFIGSNSIYYISKMKLNPKTNNFMSWNWSAFFLTYIYFFYRKMYKAGIAFFLLIALSFIPSILMANELLPQVLANPSLISTLNFDFTGMENLVMLSRFTSNIPIIVAFVSGLKANSMYCTHILIKMHNIREGAKSEDEYTETLYKAGSVNMGMAIGSAGLTVALYFLIVQVLIFLNM